LWIRLAHANIGEICTEPGIAEENLPIKHVISGDSSAFTPTPLDIGTFVSVAHKLGMAIHATVRRKNSRTLVGRPWISLWRNGTGVWVFIRLQAGERDVRISHQA
jgi:hypothetical protein